MAGLLLSGPFVQFVIRVSVEEAGDFRFLTLLLYWIFLVKCCASLCSGSNIENPKPQYFPIA